MPSAGFETAIPAIKRPQNYALDSTVTGIGRTRYRVFNKQKSTNPLYNTKHNVSSSKFHTLDAVPTYKFIPTTNNIRLLTLNIIPFCFLAFGNFVKPILGNGYIVHLYATLDRCSGGKTRSCSLRE